MLLNPLVVSAYDIGDPDRYRYEAGEVEFFANGTYTHPIPTSPLDPDVACFGDLPSRPCVLERAIYANGGITYDGPPGQFMSHEYSYVHVWGEGFFQPVTGEGQDGNVSYGLEPVPQEAALDGVATPLSRVNHGVMIAIETGAYETSDELPGAHELIQAGDRYYVVHPTASHEHRGSERTPAVVVLQWMLGFTGAFLMLRGQRHRVERR